jgi:hypothetical protein
MKWAFLNSPANMADTLFNIDAVKDTACESRPKELLPKKEGHE